MVVSDAKIEQKQSSKRIILTEFDVRGASFHGKKPELFHNNQLKRWLKCRGTSVAGNRTKLLDRIQAYQKKGSNKILDPDGGIHLRRLRLEQKLRSSSSCTDQRIDWPSDGWTLSLAQMPEFQHCYIFVHLGGDVQSNIVKLHRGAFKSKRDGYKLMKANHVTKVKFNASSHENVCFFDSRVKASMSRNKLYITRASLDKNTAKVKTASCNCKAGASGRRKHVGALLYTILDFAESGLTEIPYELTCTERPQEWHKPRSKKAANGPSLLNDLLMTKYEYEADKHKQRSKKRAQRKTMKQNYEAAPSFARKITTSDVAKLCSNLESIPDKKPMIVELLRGNSCKPIVPVFLQLKERVDTVNLDHDYLCSYKRKERDVESTKQLYEQPSKNPKLCIEPWNSNIDTSFFLSHCEVVQCPEEKKSSDNRVFTENISSLQRTEQCENHESQPSNISRQLVSHMSSNISYSDESDLQDNTFKATCKQFLNNITITDDEVSDIEEIRRGQSENQEWFKFRCGRITASRFGEIRNRRPTTTPDRIVRDIFQYKPKNYMPSQCAEGLNLESIIREKYIDKQEKNGHTGITVCERGLTISKKCPLLAASIDGEVTDSTARHSTVGNLEIKYLVFPKQLHGEKHASGLLHEIAKNTNSCLQVKDNKLCLKQNHHYYAQVQGGIAITQRQWCDFVVYSKHLNAEDLHIERIYFEPLYWNELNKKLIDFCLHAIIPEILTQRVKQGKPLQPSLFVYKK